jgi:hypothetical protein
MKNAECRKGQHQDTPATDFGAGLRRTACRACGRVAIDLTWESPVLTNRPNLFVGEQERVSIFGSVSEEDLRTLSLR